MGTVTGIEGEFKINNIVAGSYKLVVSCVGYETIYQEVNTGAQKTYAIKLKQETGSLKEVVVVGKMNNKMRKKWEDLFTAQVIGTSSFAQKCIIRNLSALRFNYTASTATLTAYCSEPLIIENPSMGYIIYYTLQHFSCSDSSNKMSYAGYSLYKEMTGSSSQEDKWRKNRIAAYDISLLKFFRSLYNGTSSEEGYRLYRPGGVSRSKQVLGSTGTNHFYTRGIVFAAVDTSLTPVDSICSWTSDGTCKLNPNHPLVISRTKESIANTAFVKEYAGAKWDEAVHRYRGGNLGVKAADIAELHRISSVLFPHENASITVMQNGYHTNGTALYLQGFFEWTEKLGTMLPLDYWPEKM